MRTNPWATTDLPATTNPVAWLWTILYTAIRDMTLTLPTPINLPHLDTDAAPGDRHRAAERLERVRDTHLYRQDLPADIRGLADRALTNAILAHHATGEEDWELITEAQNRVRAVVAYMGVEADNAVLPDTWEELTN